MKSSRRRIQNIPRGLQDPPQSLLLHLRVSLWGAAVGVAPKPDPSPTCPACGYSITFPPLLVPHPLRLVTSRPFVWSCESFVGLIKCELGLFAMKSNTNKEGG